MRSERDTLILTAKQPGWAWLRVPWDPYWHAASGAPILKGGPGHLVVWAEAGTNTLLWSVPGRVDAIAGAVTGASLLVLVALVRVNRRQGFQIDLHRYQPAAEAFGEWSNIVDRWCRAISSRRRRAPDNT